MLREFLESNGLTAEAVAERSKALETRSHADRILMAKRSDARRLKKTYEELELSKPGSLGRGVSLRSLQQVMAGGKSGRIARKKITRAVNSLLKSAKKDAVDGRALFGDLGTKSAPAEESAE